MQPTSREAGVGLWNGSNGFLGTGSVSYTHLRAHETVLDLVCRLLLEKKKNSQSTDYYTVVIDTDTVRWTYIEALKHFDTLLN